MRYVVAALAVVALAACTPRTAGTASNKAPEPSSWGKEYKWSDGLVVTVAAPGVCTPGEFAMPTKVERAVKFKITITNGTDKPYETTLLSAGSDAQFAGAKAEVVFDHGGQCGDDSVNSNTVLPGKTFSYEAAYSVGAQPGEMQLTFQPGFGEDKAVFVGQA